MHNVIKEIERFQKDRLLDKQEFSLTNESLNILEEFLELNGYKIEDRKELEATLLALLTNAEFKYDKKEVITEFDILDALGDIIVFCIGAIMKLGYNPEKVLNEVAKEINSRTGKIVNGKFIKDKGITPYQANFYKCKIDKEQMYEISKTSN